MRIFRNIRFALLASIWMLAPAGGADLRVVGSDLPGLEFTQAFYEFAGRKGVGLALAFDGSRPGLAALHAGRADLALITLPLAEFKSLTAYRALPLGHHRVLVLAAASCPLEHITLAQLALVFGAAAPGGGPARWSELGVVGDWAGAAVGTLVPEVGTGIAVEYFRQAVLGGRELRANVVRFADARALAAGLAVGPRSLALAAGVPPGAASLKVLAVAAGAKSPPVAPTIENLQAGRYPLQLPLQLVFKPDRLPALGVVWEFLFSDHAARILERAEIAVIPVEARSAQVRALAAGRAQPK